MKDSEGLRELASLVEASGLVPRGSEGVALLSGGADSACLTAALVAVCGPSSVAAIHLNYGLRDDSDAGEEAARRLCARLKIDLHIERPDLGAGNLQARAREARYAAAERLRTRLGAEWIATGHTRTDLAETLLYRLAVSPGTRALRTMRTRRGRVLRPLLEVDRDRLRTLARACELPFADDPTNLDDRFARNRIRHEVAPVLREIGPQLERNLALTHAELVEEGELLEQYAAVELGSAGEVEGGAVASTTLEGMVPVLRRIALRRMAERVAGTSVTFGSAELRRVERALAGTESRTVELGRGLRAICEAGTVRFTTGEAEPPDPATLSVPGTARFGGWEVRAEVVDPAPSPEGDLALIDPSVVGDRLEVRSWRQGDRIQPLGMSGRKSLQDLFVDAKVPRSLRRRLPVVARGEEIIWVAGVAVSEGHRHRGDGAAIVITARAVGRGSA
ncbi:MAG: tRNA lysidine(34) synthetase TilS [Solirubrobacterales bacterium]